MTGKDWLHEADKTGGVPRGGVVESDRGRQRLLSYLQTHLTADGIAERLFVSIHTVKSEMSSIYCKLGVSSRSKAVQKATAIGLLGE